MLNNFCFFRSYRLLLIIFLVTNCSLFSVEDEFEDEASDKGVKWYLSVAAIFRNDADYLKEWIEYHLLVGVEHFYLYNNLSKDHYKKVLKPYIKSGIVDLIDWPYEHKNLESWDRIQVASYNDAVVRAEKKTKWLAVIDTDEFIVPKMCDNLPDMLKFYESEYPTCSLLKVTWIVFGTSGVEKVPEDHLLIETLTLNGGPHLLYKSIFQPQHVRTDKSMHPHYAYLKKKRNALMCQLSRAQINHYMFRDLNYLYNVKLPRRKKIGTTEKAVLEWEARSNKFNSYSQDILRYIPELRQRMGLD